MRLNNFWTYRRILLTRGFLRSLRRSRQNLEASRQGAPPAYGPFMAELDVTYRCNCRCRMCQRWQDTRSDGLDLADYERLAGEFSALGVYQVSIAGGEPLLRGDIFEIIGHFAARGMSVNLCTNGMLLEKYRREIAASGATCVTVSLDAATAQCHDAIRGLAGSFRGIARGIAAYLSRRNGATAPLLRVRMTVSAANTPEIREFCQSWSGVADDVLLQPVHRCEPSYYTGLDEGGLRLDPAAISDQLQGTAMENDPYLRRLIESLSATGRFPYYPCYAGLLMVRIDPWGGVYPCLEQHVSVGSIRKGGFAAVWNSAVFDRERKRLGSHRPCRCWYNNTAMIGHFGRRLEKTLFSAAAAGRLPAARSGGRSETACCARPADPGPVTGDGLRLTAQMSVRRRGRK
ncbi:MAG: radical SAM protein [Desulfobacterales bacterium]|jgi:MoaA/NifB/PqqE/SkfB family radical SAM enzyme|nr:radical SAM protein [Desulfobacterales bacterium]